MLCGFELYSRWVPLIVKYVYGKEPRYNETKPRYIANIFSQSLGPSLNRGSTVVPPDLKISESISSFFNFGI